MVATTSRFLAHACQERRGVVDLSAKAEQLPRPLTEFTQIHSEPALLRQAELT